MLSVSRKGEKVLISVDQAMLTNAYFLKFMERMKLEEIAQKSKLTEDDAMSISEEIKDDWWQKNKANVLDGIDD